MHKIWIVVWLVAIQSSASVLGPLANGWESVNPGGGGQLQDVTCDPSVAQRVYVVCDMTGLYRSHDNGVTWEYLSDRVSVPGAYEVAVDPSDSSQLYLATSDGLYVSSTAGTDWTFAQDTDDEVFHAIEVDPNDSNRVYAGPGHHSRPIATNDYSVYLSRDAGQSWTQKFFKTGQGADREVYSIKVDPDNSSIVYMATYQGLYKSTDYGDSWTLISKPSESVNGQCFGLDLTPDGEYLYAAFDADSSSSVFVTKTSSISWNQVASGLPDIDDFYWRPQVDPRSTSSSHQVLIGPRDDYGSAHLYEGDFSVFFGLVSGSWSAVVDYDAIDRGWFDAKHRFRHFTYTPASWAGRRVWAITEFVLYWGDPSDTDSWVLRSTAQYGTDGAGTNTYMGRGFASTFNFCVDGDDEYIVTGAGDVGFVESWNGGETWFSDDVRQGDAVHICDTDPKIVLGAWSPEFGAEGVDGELKAKKLINRDSSDAWSLVAGGPDSEAGLPGYRWGAIASDPQDPSYVILGGRKVSSGGNDYGGLYAVTNIEAVVNGDPNVTFTQMFTNTAMYNSSIRNIFFDPNDSTTVYVFAHSGFFRLKNNSGTWSSTRLFDDGSYGQQDSNMYVWSHEGETRIVLAMGGNGTFLTNDTDTVIYYSDDRGDNWTSLLTLGDVKTLHDEYGWFNEWSDIQAGAAFGYQDRIVVSLNALSHKRKDLGIFCGTLQEGGISWENWSDLGDKRLTYASGREVAKVDVGGIPYLYVATTGGGLWRRSLAEAADGNLLYNPGFEGDLLPAWDADWPKLTSVNADVYEGQSAMYLKRTSAGTMNCRQVVSCKPSASYRFSAAVKTELSEGYAMMQADILNSAGGVVASYTLPSGVYGTTAYAPYTFEFSTPSNAVSIRVYLRILESAGTAWFDNVRLDDLGLLNNPGFETGELAPDWDDQYPDIETVATNIYDGSYAMRLHRGSVGVIHCRQTVNCSADTEYSLSAQMKTALTSGAAGLKVEYYNGGTVIGSDTNYQACSTSEYHPVMLDFTTPANATALKVYLRIENGKGTAWFDQVKLD